MGYNWIGHEANYLLLESRLVQMIVFDMVRLVTVE